MERDPQQDSPGNRRESSINDGSDEIGAIEFGIDEMSVHDTDPSRSSSPNLVEAQELELDP